MSSYPIAIETSPNAPNAEERAKLLEKPGFGRLFSPHMATIRYEAGKGWFDAKVTPYAPISLDPAASVLHYGQAIFEGFKAYAQKDGGLGTFRPESNAARFNRSAARLAMPDLPEELFISIADALITHEKEWVPSEVGESLYMRPLMIATEAALGVRPSKSYLFLLLASPSGAYFAQGVKPVTVWISEDYVRAAPGGTGEAKCAGNYAASLIAQANAQSHGCDQVVWLDAVHRKFIEEIGGMNIFFVWQEDGKEVLVTPELTGTLLPGVTRDSLLQIGQDLGFETAERKVTVEELGAAIRGGTVKEVFACGTAAVITPIGTIKSKAGDWQVGDGQPGEVTMGLRKHLLGVQHGHEADAHGWMHKVC